MASTWEVIESEPRSDKCETNNGGIFLEISFLTDLNKKNLISNDLNITFSLLLNLKVVMPQNSVATMTRQTVFVLVQTISSSLAQLRDLKLLANVKSFFENIISKEFDVSHYPRILLFKF